jgi:calcitonin receptor-like
LQLFSDVFCVFQETCNSRFGSHNTREYEYYSCAWCYSFLFSQARKTLIASENIPYLYNVIKKELLVPNIHNNSDVNDICSTLDNDECQRWKSCCSTAEKCCKRQLSTPLGDVNNTCGRTWDGWGCWDDTKPGQLVYQSCPLYLQYAMPTSKCNIFHTLFSNEMLKIQSLFTIMFLIKKEGKNNEIHYYNLCPRWTTIRIVISIIQPTHNMTR